MTRYCLHIYIPIVVAFLILFRAFVLHFILTRIFVFLCKPFLSSTDFLVKRETNKEINKCDTIVSLYQHKISLNRGSSIEQVFIVLGEQPTIVSFPQLHESFLTARRKSRESLRQNLFHSPRYRWGLMVFRNLPEVTMNLRLLSLRSLPASD